MFADRDSTVARMLYSTKTKECRVPAARATLFLNAQCETAGMLAFAACLLIFDDTDASSASGWAVPKMSPVFWERSFKC